MLGPDLRGHLVQPFPEVRGGERGQERVGKGSIGNGRERADGARW